MAKFKVQSIACKKSAALKTKKWRVKQRETKGDEHYRTEKALQSKLYRSRKEVKKLRQELKVAKNGSGDAVAIDQPDQPRVMDVDLEDDDDIFADKETFNISEQEVMGKTHLVFKNPFTCLIAGPTSSGKTVFTTRLIENRDEMIAPTIDEVIWCYGIDSPQIKVLKDKFPGLIKFNKGLPEMEKLKKRKEGNPDKNVLIVIDDLMSETKGGTVADLFSKGAHHLNMSVIYIVQNVFCQNKEMRNIFLNAQYRILFNNPGDQTQLTVLNSRMFPGQKMFLHNVMKEARKKNPHGYVLLDTHPRTRPELSVRSDVFPGEDNIIYKPT